MAKRPTPKKKLSADRGGDRYGAYLRKQWHKLRGQMNSPFCCFAPQKEAGDKALENITKVKA